MASYQVCLLQYLCNKYGTFYTKMGLVDFINLNRYGTVSAKIAPQLKCYKNASRLNRYNFPTDKTIDFLFSTLHSEMA